SRNAGNLPILDVTAPLVRWRCFSPRRRYMIGRRRGSPVLLLPRWASWTAPATPGMAMNLKLHAAEPLTVPADRLAYARQIVRAEAAALEQVAGRLESTFLEAVELMRRCAGRVAVTGTGKSADIGQKIAGTLNSTGTRAYILDATRAVHGDLGMVHPNDVVLALSHSGESEEVVRLLGPLRQLATALVALTGSARSTLARHADVALVYGPLEEVCPLGLAPSTSTTVMIAVGDALAFV